MLIQIRTNPSGPLRVIGGLPDANLAILEGYNGIGKTLAVRILQLCTGTMPYAPKSPAWESLREGLNEFEVEITGLQGADRVVWVADSSHWESDDEPVPRTDWFKSILIDGRSASLDDVRSLITVVRLAGDEELTDTFAAQAESHASTVRRWTAAHANPEDGTLKQLEELAGMADDLLSSNGASDFTKLKSLANNTSRDLVSKQSVVKELRASRDDIEQALDVQRRISDMSTQAPELQREIDEIDRLIAKKRSERDQAQAEVTSLATRAAQTKPLEKELVNAEKTLERNRKKLDDAWSRAAAQAIELDVDPDPETANKLVEELARQDDLLAKELLELDTTPSMVQLLAILSEELCGAESKGLGDQVAVDDIDSGLLLSVSQTRAGMETRRSQLETARPSPRAEEISTEIERVSDRKIQADSLMRILDEIERYQRLVGRNQKRVQEALQAGAGGETAKALQMATVERFECDKALQHLSVRRASVAHQLGVSGTLESRRALMGQLQKSLESLGISEDQIESELHSIAKRLAQAEADLAVAASRESDCRNKLAQAKGSIQKAMNSLDTDDRLSWVRDVYKRRQSSTQATTEQLYEDLVGAQYVVREVLERLGSHRSQLGAVERALQGLARQLRGQTVDAVKYVDQIRVWLAASFSKWFNDTRVRHELLENADEETEVVVDLEAQRVEWSESQNRRSRPLEAFSSGEQAFAYTRARLALLDNADQQVSNRLVVLDEFGAFISHHLLQGLLEYLTEWTSGRQSDQVLLILPLSRNYEEMEQSAIGAIAKQYADYAKQVEDSGYVTRIIVQ